MLSTPGVLRSCQTLAGMDEWTGLDAAIKAIVARQAGLLIGRDAAAAVLGTFDRRSRTWADAPQPAAPGDDEGEPWEPLALDNGAFSEPPVPLAAVGRGLLLFGRAVVSVVTHGKQGKTTAIWADVAPVTHKGRVLAIVGARELGPDGRAGYAREIVGLGGDPRNVDILDVQLPRGFGLDLTGPALVRSHHRSDRPRRRPNPPSTPRRTPPFGRRALRAPPLPRSPNGEPAELQTPPSETPSECPVRRFRGSGTKGPALVSESQPAASDGAIAPSTDYAGGVRLLARRTCPSPWPTPKPPSSWPRQVDQDSVFGRAPGRGQVRPRSIVGRRGEPLAGVEQEHEPFCVDTESALGRRDRRLALIVVGLAPQAVVGRGDDLTGALRPLGRVASRGALLSVLRPRFMVQDQHGRARVPSNPREPPDQGPGLRVVVQVQPEPPRPGLQRVDYDGARPGRLDGLRDLAWVGVRPDVNSGRVAAPLVNPSAERVDVFTGEHKHVRRRGPVAHPIEPGRDDGHDTGRESRLATAGATMKDAELAGPEQPASPHTGRGVKVGALCARPRPPRCAGRARSPGCARRGDGGAVAGFVFFAASSPLFSRASSGPKRRRSWGRSRVWICSLSHWRLISVWDFCAARTMPPTTILREPCDHHGARHRRSGLPKVCRHGRARLGVRTTRSGHD